MSSEPAISVKNVSKSFRYYRNNHMRIMGELLGRDVGEVIPALNDVSLEVQKGEKIALLGNIGAGRTTLARLIAGIILPDKGSVVTHGTIAPVLDNRLGFDLALSGRDNMRLKAAVLGWTESMLKEHADGIIEFAEVADVIDQPLKTFPPGGMNRIGFGMNTEFRPDIFIYDETFALGGEPYISRGVNRMEALVANEETTFLLSASNMLIAKRLCTRGIVMDKGEILFDGPFQDAFKYFKANCKIDPVLTQQVQNRIEESNDVHDNDVANDADDF